MYCVHLCPSPPTPASTRDPCHWLDVGNGQSLLVHANCHQCNQPETRLPHPLEPGPVGATVASALVSLGVVSTDTLLQAMMKVAPTWPQAWP